MSAQDAANPASAIELTRPDTVTLDIVLKGSWRLQDETPALEPVVKEISSNPQLQHVSFSSSGSGSVQFTDYLDRSQIVTRMNDAEVNLAETYR